SPGLRVSTVVWRARFLTRAEPPTGTAEAGHDLVEYEQDPVLVAERAQATEVAVRRHEDARGSRDGLDHDRRDVLGTLVPDHLLDVRERFLHIGAEHRAVGVGIQEVDDSGDARLRRPAAVVSAERHRALRLSVEGPPLREDLVAPGEEARDLDRVLVRFASAGGEDRFRQVARRDLREEPGQGGAALLAERRRDVADAFGLLLSGTHAARVAVPEVHVDETGAESEDAPIA